MTDIRQKYVLEDDISPALDKILSKMERMVVAMEKVANSLNRVSQSSVKTAASVDKMAASTQVAAQATNNMSEATSTAIVLYNRAAVAMGDNSAAAVALREALAADVIELQSVAGRAYEAEIAIRVLQNGMLSLSAPQAMLALEQLAIVLGDATVSMVALPAPQTMLALEDLRQVTESLIVPVEEVIAVTEQLRAEWFLAASGGAINLMNAIENAGLSFFDLARSGLYTTETLSSVINELYAEVEALLSVSEAAEPAAVALDAVAVAAEPAAVALEAMTASTESLDAAVVTMTPAIEAVPSVLSQISTGAEVAGNALLSMGNKGGRSFGYMGRVMTRMLLYFAAFKLFQLGGEATKEGMEQQALGNLLTNRLGSTFTGMQGGMHNTAMNTPYSELSQYQALESYSNTTNNPATLAKLLDVTKRLAETDPLHRGYDQAMKAVRTVMTTGRGMSLETYGIQRGMLIDAGKFTGNTPGTAKKPNTRDIGKFADYVNKALINAGITEGVGTAQMNTPQGITETFSNKSMTALRDAGLQLGKVFVDVEAKLTPLVDKFDKWVTSPDGTKFFNDLTDGVNKFVDASIKTFQWLHDNWNWLKYIIGVCIVAIGSFRIAMGLITGAQTILAISQALGMIPAAASLAGIGLGAMILPLTGVVALAITLVAELGYIYIKCQEIKRLKADTTAENTLAAGLAAQTASKLSTLFSKHGMKQLDIDNKLFDQHKLSGFTSVEQLNRAKSDWIQRYHPDWFPHPALAKVGNTGIARQGDKGLIPTGTSSDPIHTTVDKPINLAKEDVHMLAELAQREMVAHINMTHATPNITMHVNNSSDKPFNVEKVSKKLAAHISKSMSSQSNKAGISTKAMVHAPA